MSPSTVTAERVAQAFAAARAGDFGPSSDLGQFGADVVPLLAPYVGDGDEDIRRQAVALLAAIGGAAAITPLAAALADASQDVRQRAAVALYQHDPQRLAGHGGLGKALRDSVRAGNESGAAILLLGYFPGATTEAALRELRQRRGDGLTEVFDWSPVVPIGMVAEVALARLGDGEARDALASRIEAGDLEGLAFLLYALREIDAPTLLHALKDATLDDTRAVAGEVPSGAEPQLRLQDLAVTRFVQRLDLPVSFDVTGDRRYADSEIAAVRDAVDARIPL